MTQVLARAHECDDHDGEYEAGHALQQDVLRAEGGALAEQEGAWDAVTRGSMRLQGAAYCALNFDISIFRFLIFLTFCRDFLR